MKRKISDPEYVRLLAILRNVFSGAPLDMDLFRELSGQEWEDLFNAAARQGVLAISYEVVKDFPPESQPPRSTKIKWALSAENIEQRYARQQKAASELAAFLSGHGIRMMVFKGLALSRYFPTPSHRECGDIDAYFFGDYDKVNELMEGLGLVVDYENDKHAIFTFKGVMVENHATLTDCETAPERIIEQVLMKYINNAVLTDGGYYVPSPEFNMLFVLRHSARHFPGSGITLRHLLDWGLLLESESGHADTVALSKAVDDSGHRRFWDATTQAALFIMGGRDTAGEISKDALFLLNAIVTDNRVTAGNRGYFSRVGEKTARTFRHAPKYKLVPDKFLRDRLWRGVLFPRLRNPGRILKE